MTVTLGVQGWPVSRGVKSAVMWFEWYIWGKLDSRVMENIEFSSKPLQADLERTSLKSKRERI